MPDSANRPASARVNAAIRQLLERGGIAALATVIAGPLAVGAKLLVESSGETRCGDLGDAALNAAVIRFAQQFLATRDEARTFSIADLAPELTSLAGTRILFERIQSEPRIVIFGAGHVGAALATFASFAGYGVTLVDDRAEFVTRARFSNELIELVAAESWTKSASSVIGTGRGVSVAIVTRGHAEDEECLRAVLDSTPDYVGLIGSKRRTNIVLDRLRATGTAAEKLAKVRAPIGLDIGAVTPEEVALAILAEIVAERRGGKGGSMSAFRRVQSPKSKVQSPVDDQS